MLRCIRFEKPEVIPMRVFISPACWHHYDQEALKDLLQGHPRLFPDYQRPGGEVKPAYALNARAGQPYTDPWGCVWATADDGITGAVHAHPLETWDRFADYKAPDPQVTDGRYPLDWKKTAEGVAQARASGNLVSGGLPHGHTFLRLQDIRGYENLLLDMAEEDSRLPRLIDMVEEFNYRYVMNWLALKPGMFHYAEDLGMQVGPMISPALFRKYIKPVYRRIMKPARDHGCLIHMHSDGDIRTLADDLVDAGVQVINLQDLVNGIDWITARFAGRTCIDLDVDRQRITRFGTPEQIDALIRKEVEELGRPEGGLMMIYGLYPGTPPENAKAVMDAMEKYSTYYS